MEIDTKPLSCWQKLKNLLKQLGVIAHSKRSTGALYIDGKNYYALMGDVILSLFIIFLMLYLLISQSNNVGTIKTIKNSMIADQKVWFKEKISLVA